MAHLPRSFVRNDQGEPARGKQRVTQDFTTSEEQPAAHLDDLGITRPLKTEPDSVIQDPASFQVALAGPFHGTVGSSEMRSPEPAKASVPPPRANQVSTCPSHRVWLHRTRTSNDTGPVPSTPSPSSDRLSPINCDLVVALVAVLLRVEERPAGNRHITEPVPRVARHQNAANMPPDAPSRPPGQRSAPVAGSIHGSAPSRRRSVPQTDSLAAG